MRPPEIYETRPRCAAGCGRLWTGWHRGCNLVYCEACLPAHECPGTPGERPPPAPAAAVPALETPPQNGTGNGHKPRPPGRPRKVRT